MVHHDLKVCQLLFKYMASPLMQPKQLFVSLSFVFEESNRFKDVNFSWASVSQGNWIKSVVSLTYNVSGVALSFPLPLAVSP